MLILTVKRGNRFRITAPGLKEPVWITVTETLAHKVRLGIEATKEVKIIREELLEREGLK